jgi:hypothetical protein
MALGKTCLSVVVASSLLVSGTSPQAYEPIAKPSQDLPPQRTGPLSSSKNLLAMDPAAFAQFLKTARPAPVSAEYRARVLDSLPEKGEVTNLTAAARLKLAALIAVLRATERASVYEIKVIDVHQAAVALHARAVILISEAALTLVDADELQALLAHEIGHEYVWGERERAFQLSDRTRLRDLELVCDAIAIVTLHELGMDVSRLMSGVHKIGRFNRERFGTALNERDYPTVAQRRAFAGAVATWTSDRTTGTR